MVWTPTIRNFDNIQFEKFRRVIDGKFNDVHDELSDCYYNKKPFRSYGILAKEQFDKLHGLIFLMRDVKFHQENLKQAAKDRIPEAEYNDVTDERGIVIAKKSGIAVQRIAKLKLEGLELVI